MSQVHAIFLHFLGDALSSVFVLATALLWYFFFDPDQPTKNVWVQYVDPAASIIVVGIILFSTIPLVRSVLSVLLQRAPKVEKKRKKKKSLTKTSVRVLM